MDAAPLIGALLCTAGAIGCYLGRRHQAIRLRRLLTARSTTLEELHSLQAAVAAELGAGAFQEQIKLIAEIVCPEPLQAPWSGEPCVAFIDTETELLEEYIETTRTDSDGTSHKEGSWERRDRTLSQLERRCAFTLQQGAHSLPVEPDGADLQLETVVDAIDRSGDSAAPIGLGSEIGTRRRSLGIHRQERILRAGGSVFVVAECSDADGTLRLRAPSSDGGLFLLRRGNEDDFNRGLRRWRRIWTLSGAGLAALALTLLLLAQF